MCPRGWQTGSSWGREAFMGAGAVPRVPSYTLNSIWSWAGQPLTRSCSKLRIPSLVSQQPHVFNTVIPTISFTGGPQSPGPHGNPDGAMRGHEGQ